MSRINDALKRASQTDRRGPAAPETAGSVAAPIVTRSKFSPIALGVVILLLGALSVWLLSRALSVKQIVTPPQVTAAPRPAPPIAQPAPPPIVAVEPVAVAAAPIPNSIPQFPQLKLQAIFLTAVNPHVLINGATLGEGDSVFGAQVKRIERDRVTLEWNGETKIIALGNP